MNETTWQSHWPSFVAENRHKTQGKHAGGRPRKYRHSVERYRAYRKNVKRKQRAGVALTAETPAFPRDRYRCLVIDPPWPVVHDTGLLLELVPIRYWYQLSIRTLSIVHSSHGWCICMLLSDRPNVCFPWSIY